MSGAAAGAAGSKFQSFMNHPAGEFAFHDAYKSFEMLIVLLWAFFYRDVSFYTILIRCILVLDPHHIILISLSARTVIERPCRTQNCLFLGSYNEVVLGGCWFEGSVTACGQT